MLTLVGGVVILGLQGGPELDAALEEGADSQIDSKAQSSSGDFVQVPLPSRRWCSRRSRAIFDPIAVGRQRLGLSVERVDLVGDGEQRRSRGISGGALVTFDQV
ncbi:MAG TPA: hypothetical protein VFR23_14190 [Jiangellaceae bacterium]|nr:hypothetical protein [Jiangellaceae bacterium]